MSTFERGCIPTEIATAIVDENRLVCSGVRNMLRDAEGICVVAEAHTAAHAITMLTTVAPDVLLLELHLPDGDGFEVLESVKSNGLGTTSIVLTSSDDYGLLERALDAGASGFLHKSAVDPDQLRSVIGECFQGAVVIPEEAKARLRPPWGTRNSGRTAGLTPRETEVLTLLAAGKTNAEIAESLFVSLRTVKYHVGNILTKTGARSRTEATILAFREGVAEPGF